MDFTDNHLIAFTDGSCHPNNKSTSSRGGYGILFVSGAYTDLSVYGSLSVDKVFASNIRAEGYAIIRTMEYSTVCQEPWDKLTIVTDCEFWIKMIKDYMPKWTTKKFHEKENTDLTIKMYNLYKQLISDNKQVNFMHVKSHNKSGWNKYPDGSFEKLCYDKNDFCDKLCNYARTTLNCGDEKRDIYSNIKI